MSGGEEDDLAKITRFVFPPMVFSGLACREDAAVLEPIVMAIYTIEAMHGQADASKVFFEQTTYLEGNKTYLLRVLLPATTVHSYRRYFDIWSRNPGLIRYMYLEPHRAQHGRLYRRLVLGVLSTRSSVLPRSFQAYVQHDSTRKLAWQDGEARAGAGEKQENAIALIKAELKNLLRTEPSRGYIFKTNIQVRELSNGAQQIQWRLPNDGALNVMATAVLTDKFPGLIDDIIISAVEEQGRSLGAVNNIYLLMTILLVPSHGLRSVVDTRSMYYTKDTNDAGQVDAWLFDMSGPRTQAVPQVAQLRGRKRTRGRAEEEGEDEEIGEEDGPLVRVSRLETVAPLPLPMQEEAEEEEPEEKTQSSSPRKVPPRRAATRGRGAGQEPERKRARIEEEKKELPVLPPPPPPPVQRTESQVDLSHLLPQPTLEARKARRRREQVREQLQSEKKGWGGWISATFWPSLPSSTTTEPQETAYGDEDSWDQ